MLKEKQILSLREKLQEIRRNEGTTIPSFLSKSYEILEKGEYKDIVSWSDDGTALIIKNPTQFSEVVLPRYFKHNNLASYVRQLNIYNFKKRKTHQYEYTFVNEKFRRGKRELMLQIKRKGPDFINLISKAKPKFEENPSVEDLNLILENRTLKQVQRTMSEKIEVLEKKVSDATQLNEFLLMQIRILMNSSNKNVPSFTPENPLVELLRKLSPASISSASSSIVYNSEEQISQTLRNSSMKLMNELELSPRPRNLKDSLFSGGSNKEDVFAGLMGLISKMKNPRTFEKERGLGQSDQD